MNDDKNSKDNIVVEVFKETGVKISRDDPIVDLIFALNGQSEKLNMSLNQRIEKFNKDLEIQLDNSLGYTSNKLEDIHQILISHFDSSVDRLIENGSGILGDIDEQKIELKKIIDSIHLKETEIAKDVYVMVKNEIAKDIHNILDNELKKISEYTVKNQVNNVNKQKYMLIGLSVGIGISVVIALLFIFLLK